MNILFSKHISKEESERAPDIFRLGPAMALKHGYSSVDEFRNNVQKKFSLLETGIIQKPSTRLLLINVRSTFSVGYILRTNGGTRELLTA